MASPRVRGTKKFDFNGGLSLSEREYTAAAAPLGFGSACVSNSNQVRASAVSRCLILVSSSPPPKVSCATMSADLVWLIVRKNSCFTKRNRSQANKTNKRGSKGTHSAAARSPREWR